MSQQSPLLTWDFKWVDRCHTGTVNKVRCLITTSLWLVYKKILGICIFNLKVCHVTVPS